MALGTYLASAYLDPQGYSRGRESHRKQAPQHVGTSKTSCRAGYRDRRAAV